MCLINFVKIIDKNIKLIKDKCFWNLYYYGQEIERFFVTKEQRFFELLKNLINKKEEKNKMILNKMFLKFAINGMKSKDEEIKRMKEKEEEEEKKILKILLLKKIFKKYVKSRRFILKVIMEKWNLKSKIIGMKTHVRDKKKKRKQKQKINKLLNIKHIGSGDNNNKNNYIPRYCKSIHEFSCIISNKNANKETNGELRKSFSGNKSFKNINNSGVKNTELNEKELKKKKTKSVNKKGYYKDKKSNTLNEKDNINENNDDSDEDSGDSFGLDNNPDN